LARAQAALNDDLAAGPAEAIFDVVEEMERQFRQMNVEGA
jgi:hypothetical protein